MDQADKIENLFDEVKRDIKSANVSESCKKGDRIPSSKFTGDNKVHPLTENDAYHKLATWNNLANRNYIDEEIQNLRAALTQSYEAFVNARNTLDSISFKGIDNRIKDLHLPLNDPKIEEIVKNRPIKECLKELTDVMKDHLSNHTEDFGGIPELQTFFKVCSQLKLTVQNLLAQTKQYEDIDRRLYRAVQETEQNIANIKKTINDKQPK